MNVPNEFCVILDKDGDVVDNVSINDDIIWSIVRILDKKNVDDAPHSPWVWNGMKWSVWK